VTATDFIHEIEKYYGPYDNDHRRDVVCEYLTITFTEKELDKLYKLTVEQFSSKYKTVPDIAVFTDIVNRYNKANGEWYKYAGGKIEFLGEGIGVGKPEPAELDAPEVRRIEEGTGPDTT
jgi:hypothetical protein